MTCCAFRFPADSENGISIALFGGCLFCRRAEASADELQRIRAEYQARRARMEHVDARRYFEEGTA